jgi:general nucleoside transport system permease protein
MNVRFVNIIRTIAYLLVAMILCGVIFELAGYSTRLIAHSIADGAFLSARAWQNSLRWGIPLFITAVGVVISFRCGYFNVGAQGQFYLGAICATFVVDGLNGAPALIVIPLSFLAGSAGGALWALWPALLKIRSGADEVITTLMGNFIAGLLLIQVCSGVLGDPSGTGQVMASRPINAAYRISSSAGLSPSIIAIVLVVGVAAWLLVNRTAFGVLSGLAGRNPIMALWQGANVSRLGLIAFVMSGALAGLAGTIEVLGPNGRLVSGFQPAHGFTAILTALVANLSVSATALAAIFFGGLAAAALYLPVIVGLPAAAIDMMNAAIALFVTARAWPQSLGTLHQSRRDRDPV